MKNLIAAKEKAYKLKRYIEETHKKVKISTPFYKETIIKLDNFLKCNLKDKSIYSKYEKVRDLFSKN